MKKYKPGRKKTYIAVLCIAALVLILSGTALVHHIGKGTAAPDTTAEGQNGAAEENDSDEGTDGAKAGNDEGGGPDSAASDHPENGTDVAKGRNESCEGTDGTGAAGDTDTGRSGGRYDISLGFAGDICFADNYLPVEHYNAIGADSLSDVISQDTIDAMRSMDLMWINNEFCYSRRGAPLPGKLYTFRADPSHAAWLHDLGVDIVGLANNHVYDYGGDAFEDTLTALTDAGIPYVGAGHNLAEAMRPYYFTVDGVRIAYVAASRAEKYRMTPQATDTAGGILRCYDNTLFLQAIREAAANADFVIALPHWGTEHSTVLESAQTDGARAYIAAGADAVIGAHPHILQGIEFVENKPVFYSLGNFWFDEAAEDTGIVKLRLTGPCAADGTPLVDRGNVQVTFLPARQENIETHMAIDPSVRSRIFADLESISVNARILDDGTVVQKSE